MATPEQAGRFAVEVVCVAAPMVVVQRVLVPHGQTLGWAAHASGIFARYPDMKAGALGLWGKILPPETVLQAGDRVEMYRPVLPQAKAAVRRRHGGVPAAETAAADVPLAEADVVSGLPYELK